MLNLAVKLYLRNPGQTTLLCQYVLSLARYDANYDIRDRARLLRLLLFPTPGTEVTMIFCVNHKSFSLIANHFDRVTRMSE